MHELILVPGITSLHNALLPARLFMVLETVKLDPGLSYGLTGTKCGETTTSLSSLVGCTPASTACTWLVFEGSLLNQVQLLLHQSPQVLPAKFSSKK